MKEKLYTIELTDAVQSGDECLFCRLVRKLEQENLEFVLGSSYMESDVREQTSKKGFCRQHTKMMYDYGNTLGNAWILKSRMERMRQEFSRKVQACGVKMPAESSSKTPGTRSGTISGTMSASKSGSWLSRLRRSDKDAPSGTAQSSAMPELSQWLRSEEKHCYICSRMQEIYERMLDTFVYMLRDDPEFAAALMESKGFCLTHFADVLAVCGEKMKPQERDEWMPRLCRMMSDNLDRVQDDIDWLIEKYDYRNKDADWRQSRDAVQRAMQKLTGGHPADPVFQCRK